MINLIEEKLTKVGPKEAQRMLSFNTLQSQRPTRPKHVNELSEAMTNDLFLTGNVALVKLNYNGGQTVMVNGQHQCLAIIDSERTVSILFQKYGVDSDVELSLLYRQFDNHASRTLNDAIRPEGVALGICWPMRIQTLVVTAAALREGTGWLNKQAKIPLLAKYMAHGDFMASIIAPENALLNHAKHLVRGPVALAMMLTWEKSRIDSKLFWEEVRDGEGLKRKSPTMQLRDYLRETNSNMGSGIRGYQRTASPHEMLSKCITAWNAYRKDLSTTLKYYSDKPVPKAI